MKIFAKFYAFLFFILAEKSLLDLFNSHSQITVYYKTTIIFSNWLIAPYFFNIFDALLNLFVSLLIFAYAFDMQGLFKTTRWFLFVRLIADCLGHSYRMKIMQADFVQGNLPGLLGMLTVLLPVLPSYLIQWRMSRK